MQAKPVKIILGAFLMVMVAVSCGQPSPTPDDTVSQESLSSGSNQAQIIVSTPSLTATGSTASPVEADWTINPGNISQIVPLAEIGTPSLGKIVDVAWTPEGTHVAVAAEEEVFMFNVATWQLEWSVNAPIEILDIRFNQDTSRLLVKTREAAYVYDARSGEYLLTTSSLSSISPDKNKIATDIGIVDIRSGEIIVKFTIPAYTDIWEYPATIEFSPDGTRVIMGMNHGSFFVWDATTGALAFQYRSSRESRDCYQLGSTEKYLVMQCFMPYDIYNETETQIRYITLDEPYSMELKTVRSGDNPGYKNFTLIAERDLIAWQVDDEVLLFDLDNRALQSGIQTDISFSGEFSLSLEADTNWLLNWYGNVLQIWNLHTNALVKQFGSDAAARIVLNPAEDRQVAVSRYDGSLTLWNFESGMQLLHLVSEDHYPLSAAFSPGGEQLVVGGEDGHLWVYNLTSGHMEPTSYILSYQNFNALAFMPNGSTLAAARVSTDLFDYPVTDESSVKMTVAPNIYPENLKYNPDGEVLAIFGTARTVELYNAKGQWQTSLYSRFYNETYDLAFSPDGSMLASAGGGLWVMDSYEQVLEFTGDTSSLAFSPDQCLLATGQTDGSILFWDVQSEQYLDPMNMHSDDVTGVAFSHDGRILYTASRSGSVTAWGLPGALDVEPGSPLNITCAAFFPPTPAPNFSPTPTRASTTVPLDTNTPSPSFSPTQSPPAFQRSLFLTSPHMQGEDVLVLQNRLLLLNYTEVGSPDGDFGQKTDQAVRRFQVVNGLEADGVVGPITWELLFSDKAISG